MARGLCRLRSLESRQPSAASSMSSSAPPLILSLLGWFASPAVSRPAHSSTTLPAPLPPSLSLRRSTAQEPRSPLLSTPLTPSLSAPRDPRLLLYVRLGGRPSPLRFLAPIVAIANRSSRAARGPRPPSSDAFRFRIRTRTTTAQVCDAGSKARRPTAKKGDSFFRGAGGPIQDREVDGSQTEIWNGRTRG